MTDVRAIGTAEREVTISDARAIRAVAHEARQRVIEVLYAEQRPYTATQLARLTELSPSAMSYHLRALERWGVVERAEGDGDSRTRPWRAAGTSISIRGEGPAADAAHDALLAETFRALGQRMRAVRRRPTGERPRYVGLAIGELWLTEEQIDALGPAVERAIVALTESGWVNEPGPGRQRVAFLWSLLPDPFPQKVASGSETPPG